MVDKIWNHNHQNWEIDTKSYPYRSKWVCFKCRKTMLKVIEQSQKNVHCPICKSSCSDLGYLFESPSRTNDKKWKVVELLSQYNYRYNSKSAVVYIKNFIANDRFSISQIEEILKLKRH